MLLQELVVAVLLMLVALLIPVALLALLRELVVAVLLMLVAPPVVAMM